MELILATADGREEGYVSNDIDIDIGDTNDFEMTVSVADWSEYDYSNGKRMYVPGTEYGGLIGDIESNTDESVIYVRGYTWRGLLQKKIIVPPSGQDYYIISGDLNTCIATLISGRFGALFQASDKTTVSVTNYQFDRYCTLVDGITKMCESAGYKLVIRYIQTDTGGYVELAAEQQQNYADDISISQDSRMNFISDKKQNGINHLICLGSGELKDRIVVNLYADVNGNISQTQTLFGLDERTEVYDFNNASEDDLIKNGTEHLLQEISRSTFKASMNDVDDLNVDIGDIISGQDYITGIIVSQPIAHKILKSESGQVSIEYQLEGEK